MKYFFTLSIFLFFSSSVILCQESAQTKKLAKIDKLLQKNKVEKAEKKLINLLEEYNNYGDAWDRLASVKNHYYLQSQNTPGEFKNMVVTVTDAEGNLLENDSSANLLINLLRGMNPEYKAYDNYLYTLRMATAIAPEAYHSSMNLRSLLRDNYEDTTLQKREIDLFDLAEKEFAANNFNKAAIYYQKALDVNPNYYKALLYLGDSYYRMENYIDAIEKFKLCIERFPKALEPRKYLVDSYLGEGLYEKALEQAIESKYAYPDLILNYRLLQSAYGLDKDVMVWAIPRQVLPNKEIYTLDTLTITSSKIPENQPELSVKDYWKTYVEAEELIRPYAANNGRIQEKTGLTNSTYTEVFRWEKMLAENDDPDLETAKEMQRLGYLDCYALITCFHDDFYPQYRHFADNNKEKIIQYYQDVVLKPKN